MEETSYRNETVCRFCLTNSGKLQSIFDNEIIDIPATVMKITNLGISKNDPFSKVACNPCIDIIVSIEEFREKCLSSFHQSEHKLFEVKESSLSQELQLQVEFVKCESLGNGCNSYEQEDAISNRTDTEQVDNGESIKEDAIAEKYRNNRNGCTLSSETAKYSFFKSSSYDQSRHSAICTKCGESVSGGKQMLIYHMKSDHANDAELPKIRQCFYCPKAYSSYQLLKYHLNFHPQKMWQCPQCDKRIHNKAIFIDHLRIHANERYYGCKECGKRFTALKYISSHSRLHKRNIVNDSEKKTDTSHEIWSRSEQFTSHTQSTYLLHEDQQDCKGQQSLMDSLYSNDQNIKSTPNRTETNKSEIYECEVCGKKLKTKSNYTNHRKMHARKNTNTGLNVVPATCSATVQRRVYLCNICGHNCGSSSNLGVHLRRHNGQSVCECSVCGKGFPRRSDLVMHMRKHTGEKPFICPTCGRGFSRLDKVRIHIRTHTGEKPYTCPCGRAYAQKNDLKTHQKRNSCGQNFNIAKLNTSHPRTICIKSPKHTLSAAANESHTREANDRDLNCMPVSYSTSATSSHMLHTDSMDMVFPVNWNNCITEHEFQSQGRVVADGYENA
ncbi:zinc finger protein 432-like [Anopheles funestus]|uniref:Protein krueppel n=1 Tax=Anopheles funestus TaxID=62324 RepID=A0A4Y0BHE5_ANOFN|nr:zinc finger protein 432-like [Anopheles funestus]